MSSPNLKAVLFDIGGVVVQSPLLAIQDYEFEHGIPHNYINCSITARGSQGAWQKFERGQIPLLPFYEQFSQELSDVDNGNKWYAEYCERKNIACPELPQKLHIDGRELFGRMMRTSQKVDKCVYEAILRIRAERRWRLIALTNNYSRVDTTFLDLNGRHSEQYPSVTLESELKFLGWEGGAVPSYIRESFDDFIDSSEVGMRKPEHRFYLLACKRNHIQAHEAVFLDDLGINLKAARELGMETIHVPIGGAVTALKTLGHKLGINLTEGLETEALLPSKL
ncbi:HAD-like protein [Multifurca ochricompacta]|uniref:HAD-like protein n=1 Tax=Multifurca ochricompacta TaxID=376703 RepID=A0AAD4MBX6_9AGAM|nr:HAD-like protein [Multifurca ochricompacta]